jgi:hypothetical protein
MGLRMDLFEVVVPEKITKELLNYFDNIKNDSTKLVKELTYTVGGIQTGNLCYEENIQEQLYQILKIIGENNLRYRWFHMIDYNEKGGYQEIHNHERTEDYSYILYLTTCNNGGKTFFIKKDNTTISIKPEKNKLVFFPSDIYHWAEETIDRKKIAVGALVEKMAI